MRVALYARVSTDEQTEKFGLDSQLRSLRDRAKARGWEVVAEFVDDGYSGATLERPELTKLRDAATSGAFDLVLTHSPDRLARDLMFSLLLERELKKCGRSVEYVSLAADDSPAGILTRQMMGAIAEFERHTIKERTARGRREKALRGLLPGGPCPFGYRPDATQLGGLVIEPAEAETVRAIFAWSLDGAFLRKIVDRLNAQPIRPRRGGRWAKSSVRRLLTSELYAGRAYYNRRLPTATGTAPFRASSEWIMIPVPAIVSAATFQRTQAQLARNRVVGSGHPGHRLYLLKSLLVCRCGRRLHGMASHARRVYRCTGRDRLVAAEGERCRAPVRSAERIEAAVWDTVAGVIRDPSVLLAKVKAGRAALDSARVAAQSEVGELQRQLAKVRKQRERLLQLYLDEHVTQAVYTPKAGELARQEEMLTSRLAEAEATAASGAAQAQRQDAVLAYCRLVQKGLDRLDAAGRQRLLRLLVDRVVVHAQRLEVHGLLPTDGALPTAPGDGRKQPTNRENIAVDNRSESQDVVAAGRRHLERALRVFLAVNVGEVAGGEARRGEERRGIDRRRRARCLPAEVRDGVRQRLDADHRRPARERRLGGVRRRDDQPAHGGAPGGGRDGQGTADGMDAPVEAELAERTPWGELGERRLRLGGEDAEGDRQIVVRALLPHAGRGEVHGDAALRIREARVPERRADAVARLADGAVGETDGRGVRQARGHVDLDVDEERVDAAERAGTDAGEHRLLVALVPCQSNR